MNRADPPLWGAKQRVLYLHSFLSKCSASIDPALSGGWALTQVLSEQRQRTRPSLCQVPSHPVPAGEGRADEQKRGLGMTWLTALVSRRKNKELIA